MERQLKIVCDRNRKYKNGEYTRVHTEQILKCIQANG